MVYALHSTLTSVFADHPDHRAVRTLVDHVRRMALAYLRQKTHAGSLRADCFGLTLEDLALDCCAELFERDEQGRFTVLQTYFERLGWPAMGEAEVQMALRRITFSKTNEELFRRYRTSDPNLAKIVRNLKDAVRVLPEVRLERRGRQRWIVVGRDEPFHAQRLAIPPEFLEAHLAGVVGSSMQVREAMAALVRFVRLRPSYQNGFPLMAFAKLVRSVFIRLAAAASEDREREAVFTQEEVVRAIEAATEAIRARIHTTYVRTGKTMASTVAVYLQTVRSILEAQYIHDTASDYSYFEILASHAPGTSEAEYRREHRNRVEYLVKLARADLADHLREEPAVRAMAAA